MWSPAFARFVSIIFVSLCLGSAVFAQITRRTGGAGPLGSVAPAAPSVPRPKAADILAEINLARSNPAKYATYLVSMKTQFRGKTLVRPGRIDLVTTEGVAAVDEAINYLRAAKALPAFQLSVGMSRGATDHSADLAFNGLSGHKGSDGSLPEDRCGRYGRLIGNDVVGENIAYDGLTAREVVIGFIVDDGTANRGHRRNVFSPAYKILGISIGPPSPNREALYVVTFAAGFSEKTSEPAKGKTATARQM